MGTEWNDSINYLGCGYDVTGRYCHPSAVRNSIIDIKTFMQKESNRYSFNHNTTTDTKVFQAENATKYCEQLAVSLALDVKYKVFGGSLSIKFNNKKECSSQYSFGSYFMVIRNETLALNLSKHIINTIIEEYLTKPFLDDLETESCEDLIKIYGTHLITNMTLGARLEVSCRSLVEDNAKVTSIDASLKASVDKIGSLKIDGSYTQDSLNKNKDLTVTIETIGGDPSKSIVDSFDFNNFNSGLKSNFSNWQGSLTNQNMTLIEMAEKSLIPIADLIKNETKKKEFKVAVDTYLCGKEFQMVDEKPKLKPLYRYFNHQTDDLFFTMNAHELGRGGGGANYSFGRIECMLYDTYIEGTVPLYRYFSEKKHDHVYTTNWNDYQSGSADYKHEGICGYVFASANGDTDRKLVPLYKCVVNPTGNTDHFYSLDPKEVVDRRPDIQPPHIECYVYIPTKKEDDEARKAIGIL